MPKQAERAGRRAGPFALFAILSLAAVAMGCVAASRGGAPAGEWARNVAAWALGAVLAAALGRWAGPRVCWGLLAATPVVLGLTFVGAGQEGVHRWVQLGPLRMNAAEVLAPAAIVACAALQKRGWLALGLAGLGLSLLAAQPDASQATAFGAALLVLLIGKPGSFAIRGAVAAAIVGVAAVSWGRPDPLAPVAEVEGIMGLARGVSPLLAVGAWATLAGAALAPLAAVGAEADGARTAAFALAAYAALAALMPLVGAFPVPLVGMGMSPILGLWLGVGLLSAVAGRKP